MTSKGAVLPLLRRAPPSRTFRAARPVAVINNSIRGPASSIIASGQPTGRRAGLLLRNHQASQFRAFSQSLSRAYVDEEGNFDPRQIERESDPYFATARLWDDGIIDPRETRTILAIALMAVHQRPVEGTMEWGVFRH